MLLERSGAKVAASDGRAASCKGKRSGAKVAASEGCAASCKGCLQQIRARSTFQPIQHLC
eukprot:1570760-Rhodomonas_salina.2